MSKKIDYRDTAMDKLVSGVNKTVDAIKVTMGAEGLNVLIENLSTGPQLTKDGVTVANSIFLEDPIENMACSLVKDAGKQAFEKSGDGTTLTSVLTQDILNLSVEQLSRSDISAPKIIKEINKAKDQIIDLLKKKTDPVESKTDIISVADISSNGDSEVTKLIGEAVDKIDISNGMIEIRESTIGSTYIDIIDGMRFYDGFAAQYFMNTDNETVEYKNPNILLVLDKIDTVQDMLPALQYLSEKEKPMIIICGGAETEVVGTMVINKVKQGLPVALVKVSGTAKQKEAVFADLACVTGGDVISEGFGNSFNDIAEGKIKVGSCNNIVITEEHTTIYEGSGDADKKADYIENLKKLRDTSENEFDRSEYKRRLSQHFEGVATIHLHANTETELKERMDRLDDTVKAVKAAYAEGIVPGGGVALRDIAVDLITREYNDGTFVMLTAITKPYFQILSNASMEIVEPIELGMGYNVRTGKKVNMYSEGIIDATKSIRVALESAVSTACNILMVGATITEKRDQA